MQRADTSVRAALLALGVFSSVACQGPLAQRRQEQAELAVRAAIDEYCDAYAARDLQRALGCFARDGEVVCIGTGKDETRVGREQLKVQLLRDWEQSQSAAIRIETQHLMVDGDAASVIGTCRFVYTAGGTSGQLDGRYSAGLRRERGAWRIVHLLAAVPAGDEPAGESFRAR